MDFAAAYSGTRPAMVDFSATVTSNPRFFYGSRTHCEHEAFSIRTPQGPAEIVDNVAIAPRIPVQPGDHIEVRGQLVHDPDRVPVIHWTHHDPQGTHAGGFIRLHGRTYA